MSRRALATLSFAIFLAGCRPAPPPPASPSPSPAPDLVRVEASELTALGDDAPRETLVAAIDHDVESLGRRPADEIIRLADAACSVAEMQKSLAALREAAATSGSGDLAAYARGHFAFYHSAGRPDGALVTGYFEPIVDGRRSRQGEFVYPLYGRPEDLIEVHLGDFFTDGSGRTIAGRVAGGKLEPYPSRREIDGDNVLAGRGLELAWLDDSVARYFLHVQGSGMVRLADGSTFRVGFAASNGKPYTSIGSLLAADGSLGGEAASAPAIQHFLRSHPERRDEILFRNERYVFFHEIADGPIGKLGVKLTEGRSIAVDAALYPLATLAYLATEAPTVDSSGQATGRRPLRRFVLAQDTGVAITGPGRLDLFFGSGPAAGLEAGYMSEGGELYFLMPRECISPSP